MPVAGLAYTQRRSLRWVHIAALGVLATAIFIYIAPLANYFVAAGVWYYDPRQILTLIFGYLPVEEYLFFALQALLVGLFTLWLWRRFYPANYTPKSEIESPERFKDQ